MEEPLNGAIARTLDPGDFVGLIQEHIIAAGWHGERLALVLGLAPNGHSRPTVRENETP